MKRVVNAFKRTLIINDSPRIIASFCADNGRMYFLMIEKTIYMRLFCDDKHQIKHQVVGFLVCPDCFFNRGLKSVSRFLPVNTVGQAWVTITVLCFLQWGGGLRFGG